MNDAVDCVLDADRRELTVSGNPVTTQPKAFELLLYLVRNRSRAVDKDELQDALWEAKIRVRAQRQNRRVRLCAHLYVNPDDISRTLDVVRTLERSWRPAARCPRWASRWCPMRPA